MEFNHVPVMAEQCIRALNIKEDGVFVDGTTGGGSHSALIAERLKSGSLICIDKDGDAIAHAKTKLSSCKNVVFVKDDYKNLMQILKEQQVDFIDGILLDLGVSSYQLDNAERGFSYIRNAPLDMRMDRTSSKSAFNVINGYDEKELSDVFFKYGEEKFSRRIAKAIVKAREKKELKTTGELVKLIEDTIPLRSRVKGSHPAKRVFQAVRIEVNGELYGLSEFIKEIPHVLNKNGRIAVITFHSLEDRIIKKAFNEMQNPCICPKDFPVCACGKKSLGFSVYKKPVIPDTCEIVSNPRSKSAKLRVFETR